MGWAVIPAMCTRRWLLGQACKVVVTKDETTVVDGAGKVEQISGRVNQIRNGMAQVGPDGFVRQGEVGVGPTPTMESPSGTPGAAERPRRRM